VRRGPGAVKIEVVMVIVVIIVVVVVGVEKMVVGETIVGEPVPHETHYRPGWPFRQPGKSLYGHMMEPRQARLRLNQDSRFRPG